MPLDLFTSFVTRCSPYIRRMGYLDEAIGMSKRYRSCRSAWQSHLEQSKQAVLAAAGRCPHKDKVIILGSGLLLDVPLQALATQFREVVLMDVVCLPEACKEIRSFSNVTFMEHDVTHIAQRLYESMEERAPELPESTPPAEQYQKADLVISLNILSQIWVVPRAYVISRRTSLSPEQLDDWCGRIVQAHYGCLRALPCHVCLVADYAFVKRDRERKIFSRDSTVYGLDLPEPDATWTWNIAPLEQNYCSKELAVGAWHIAPEAGRPASDKGDLAGG